MSHRSSFALRSLLLSFTTRAIAQGALCRHVPKSKVPGKKHDRLPFRLTAGNVLGHGGVLLRLSVQYADGALRGQDVPGAMVRFGPPRNQPVWAGTGASVRSLSAWARRPCEPKCAKQARCATCPS